ncbi:alpha/beta fold hydrolase [Paracoccus aestuarii]|uniref:Alpha/beta fold hydrolase n=1 Tax=Paracoccus aestuarii TaxID=453842 RepID=A0A418ZQR5_9RHOB|nr:alpha/beta fold hydrolase [Paracoccus aestuarii]RJK97320.1 alpha/beta fold hydrolase [Paracoccus aestuarii]WCQ98494.1 alpha/beta fold hydrolase [Paracoccus aestuarii]
MTGVNIRHWPGDADGPALALHCMMGSAASWGPVAEALAGRVDLRAFDMPGHGRSGDWMPGAQDPDYHTAVTRMAAAMIDRPLDLIGHSFGATVALRIAVAAPDAIRSLTLIEPVLFAAAPSADQDRLDAALGDLLADDRDAEAAALFLRAWNGQDLAALPAPIQAQLTRQIRLVSLTAPALREDSGRILREGGLESLDAPVLLIRGADSPPVIEAIGDALAHRLNDVGRAVVPGAGHMLPLTHPAQVAGLIGANLDRA